MIINAEEGRGNSYDFGARVQDPRIGRFLSLDPLKSSFPWQSSYLFAGNDPIRYIDKEGCFKLSASDQIKYPRLTQILMNMEKLMGNKRLMQEFETFTGSASFNLIGDLHWGSGPMVEIEDLENAFGLYDPKKKDTNTIYIDSDLISIYEQATDKKEVLSYQFGIVVTVLHEDIHANDYKVDYEQDNIGIEIIIKEFGAGQSNIDLGQGFEENLFGTKLPKKSSKATDNDWVNRFNYQLNFKKQNKNFIVVPYKEVLPINQNKKDGE